MRRAPLNRAAGNPECKCGVPRADDPERTEECPFTPALDKLGDLGELCSRCRDWENTPIHGPADRCHGIKLHEWTLGESGCFDPREHHTFRAHPRKALQIKDIPDEIVLAACDHFHSDVMGVPTPEESLANRYPPKLTLAKMDSLARRGLIEWGVSLRTAWRVQK